MRQRHGVRHQQARRARHGTGDGLVPRGPARRRRGPDVRHPQQVQDAADRPVLARRPVQHRPDDVDAPARQEREQAGVDVTLDHRAAAVPERLRDATSRTQRHVALVREPAGEHEDTRSQVHGRHSGEEEGGVR